MLLSIIIPVYNAENYIVEALNSLVSQTYKNWECILIDDCSTDTTRQLITKFINNHPDNNFVYKHNESNLRQGLCRNLGVELASGDYFLFMDNDDILPINALELMAKNITDAQLLVGNFARFQDGGNHEDVIFTGSISHDNFFIPREEAFSNLYNMVYPWAKLYKKDFWQKHDFKFPREKFEDTIIWPAISSHAKKIIVINEVIYLHRVGNINSDGSRIPPSFKLYYSSLQVRLNTLKKYGILNTENYYWSFCLADAYQHIEDMSFSYQRYKMFKLLKSFMPKLPEDKYLAKEIIPPYKVRKLKKMYDRGILYFIKPKTHFLKRLFRKA